MALRRARHAIVSRRNSIGWCPDHSNSIDRCWATRGPHAFEYICIYLPTRASQNSFILLEFIIRDSSFTSYCDTSIRINAVKWNNICNKTDFLFYCTHGIGPTRYSRVTSSSRFFFSSIFDEHTHYADVYIIRRHACFRNTGCDVSHMALTNPC